MANPYAAQAVREWLDRRKIKPAGPPSDETIKEIEQMIDDLESPRGR